MFYFDELEETKKINELYYQEYSKMETPEEIQLLEQQTENLYWELFKIKIAEKYEEKDYFYRYLNYDTRTTKLLDDFSHSRKQLLILQLNSYTKLIILLGTHYIRNFKGSFTMTDLKQNRSYLISSLDRGIKESKKIDGCDQILFFDKPFLLRAQNSYMKNYAQFGDYYRYFIVGTIK